jgi:hypothetical protein
VTFLAILRRPSAFLPLVMSLAALVMVAWYVAVHGVVRGEDEGVAARLFQLLVAAQLPISAFFAVSWLPRAPRPAAVILALQACAWLAAIGTVAVLER